MGVLGADDTVSGIGAGRAGHLILGYQKSVPGPARPDAASGCEVQRDQRTTPINLLIECWCLTYFIQKRAISYVHIALVAINLVFLLMPIVDRRWMLTNGNL